MPPREKLIKATYQGYLRVPNEKSGPLPQENYSNIESPCGGVGSSQHIQNDIHALHNAFKVLLYGKRCNHGLDRVATFRESNGYGYWLDPELFELDSDSKLETQLKSGFRFEHPGALRLSDWDKGIKHIREQS